MYNPSEQEIYDEQKKRQQPATDQSAYTYVDDGKGNIVPGPGVGITPQTQQSAATEQPVVTQPATETPYEVPFAVDKANNYPSSGQQTVTPVVNTEEQQTATETPETEQTVTEQPDLQQAVNTYKFGWGKEGASLYDILHGEAKDRPIAEVLSDYQRWTQDSGKPFDIFAINEAMHDRDISKSIEQNEIDKKKAERKAKWDSVGTFITHLGNFIGAAGWGGNVNLEDPAKLTERQRQLREATLARRNAYNKELMAQYWNSVKDSRDNQHNLARIGLIQQQIDAIKEEQKRKDAINGANVELAGARKIQAESSSRLNDQRAKSEEALRPERVKTEKAKQSSAYASASASRARASATNKASYGNDYRNNRHKIWAENKRKYQADTEEFMKENGIHSYDKKNWSSELIDQYNAWIADRKANTGTQKTKVNY